MDVPVLLHKLMEIERALTQHDDCAVRNLLIATQEGVLALEQENETLAIENAGLRRRLDAARHATLPYAAHTPGVPDWIAQASQPQRRETLSAEPAAHELHLEAAAPTRPTGAPDPDDTRPPRTWRITHFFFS
jgi:regulator of replication initiation timing